MPYKHRCSSLASRTIGSESRLPSWRVKHQVACLASQVWQLFSTRWPKQPRRSVLVVSASQWAQMPFHRTWPLLASVSPGSIRTWSRCVSAFWPTRYGTCGKPSVTSAISLSFLQWRVHHLSFLTTLYLVTNWSYIIFRLGSEISFWSVPHFGQAATPQKTTPQRLVSELLKL